MSVYSPLNLSIAQKLGQSDWWSARRQTEKRVLATPAVNRNRPPSALWRSQAVTRFSTLRTG
ncbi:unnamed protein product [Oikopleura dioica]|uniref:Uncharacterized protein n=1 Tax=Oikopleura dioica TaxID=34765 RepID=E4XH46_OIKDI|nr:unnamed protein product [Oikopleura dioica]